ncbi:MAG: sarcosine oxidase subunit gamma, partial [Rhizobiaceae bacterium]
MDKVQQIAPLEGRKFAADGISLEPAHFCERIALRANTDATAEIGKAIGIALPVKPKTSKVLKKGSALWLGPDEWLILVPPDTGLADKLAKLDGLLFSAIDISHRNTAIYVEGPHAVSSLNAGCPQ